MVTLLSKLKNCYGDRLFTVPYFSVRFPIFPWTVILVSWCERNWGENKMPLGRGGGANSVGWEGGKNRETVTALLCLVFTELVAPATATPDWSRDNRVHQSAAYRWQLEWQEVAFITSPLSAKWHRFQKNFLKIVLILIVCLLLVLEDRC